ncbi:MAG: DUF2461 domain-containing protein [Prevotella sp.]|nr:DUF2461 domain-containing protein [Prevotella sp.]
MDTKRIISFLRQVMENNNRPWFQEHKEEYMAVRADFEAGIAEAINRIATFDPDIAHVTVKDAVYRFYRDTRFTTDKSPYKNHLGAYINAKGKKALRGGYYIHVEPDHCLLAIGNYWLPTNILTACRNEIMGNEAEWLRCVENDEFKRYFDSDEVHTDWEESWDAPQGFGLTKLKTCPAGFPRDYAHVKYLRLKDYCCWHAVGNDFFSQADWLDRMEDIFRTGKPMMDFTNSVIDDYE